LFNKKDLLLISDVISLANEAFFVGFPHMCEKFVTPKESLFTEFAKWMDTTFDVLFGFFPFVMLWCSRASSIRR
jgi:hypothetical protein